MAGFNYKWLVFPSYYDRQQTSTYLIIIAKAVFCSIICRNRQTSNSPTRDLTHQRSFTREEISRSRCFGKASTLTHSLILWVVLSCFLSFYKDPWARYCRKGHSTNHFLPCHSDDSTVIRFALQYVLLISIFREQDFRILCFFFVITYCKLILFIKV